MEQELVALRANDCETVCRNGNAEILSFAAFICRVHVETCISSPSDSDDDLIASQPPLHWLRIDVSRFFSVYLGGES
jgi:hypothetical protein